MNKFEGSSKYIAGEELLNSVNVAMALQKPFAYQGRTGYRQNNACRSNSRVTWYGAYHLEHQVNNQGSGRSVSV